jgi:Fe-S-cluster-containing dehydrogenase component/anaerobic selenocysteine-containing dehydrogenase
MSSEMTKSSSGQKVFWRSLETKDGPAALSDEAHGSDVVKATIGVQELSRLKRRTFLTLSGAISAMAGLEGCIRRPVEKILPYTQAPEDVSPGVPLHYASVSNRRGEAIGLLVQAYEGRPTKIEGNPDHPASLGSTDLLTQASILDLYDTDRGRTPTHAGIAKGYDEIDGLLKDVAEKYGKNGGAGLRVLAQPTNSPSFLRLRAAIKSRMPSARFHVYAPINDSNERAGAKIAFGQPLLVQPRIENAKVIVALDSDFLMTETGNVLAARQFSRGRTMKSSADEAPNRLYVVEPSLSVTGSNADHRLRMSAQSIGAYAKALAAELAAHGISVGSNIGSALGAAKLDGVPERWLKAVAKDLASHKGHSLVLAGSRQPPVVHALVHAINNALENAGRTVNYVAAADTEEQDNVDDIRALAHDMSSGQVQALLILGGNPVYDAPADLKFKEALGKVPLSICATDRADETGAACTWHVPRAHELETWGDQLSRSGHYAIQQPLIAPLFDARSDIELLAVLAGEEARGATIVRATANAHGLGEELTWQGVLQKGIAPGMQAQVMGAIPLMDDAIATAVRLLPAPAATGPENLEAVFLSDTKLFDGRFANNAWLLELPDPITRIVWDNVALFAPSTAKQLGIKNGDVVRISAGGASIEIAAWMQPGQAQGSIGLPLGWGRTRAGGNGVGAGFDVYPLRSSAAPYFVAGAKVEKTGKHYTLSQTQEHDVMEGRPIALDESVDDYRGQGDFTQWHSPDPSSPPLWKVQDYSHGHQWGMVIDLNTCIGCSACAIACQAENNVSTVGKDQVGRGREMHWLRIDRYYLGDDADEPEVAFQPLACQHCEQAPCENVCPVNATSHSPEGLNDIAYNRCIGTRYCMNNCPYKVRRFNFLNFNLDVPETRKMQFNPNVTVRFRGVIEKCSYCVQRIQTSKIAAKREGREMKDGDVVSACQQACPTQAITFGDINDPDSRVSTARKIDRNYALLADVGTHPRTRFLGKIRNPNPEMKG